jgi:APA family basic amino acid/polyamine antiporter
LRRRHPELERPFRAWGYPWAPALFIVASGAMVTNELWRSPATSAAGVALIAFGIPVYWFSRRQFARRLGDNP